MRAKATGDLVAKIVLDTDWLMTPQAAAAVRILFGAGGPLGAWLIQHNGWTIGDLQLLTNFLIGFLATIPLFLSLIGALYANSQGAIIQSVANMKEIDAIVVNTDKITPSVSSPKVSVNENGHGDGH